MQAPRDTRHYESKLFATRPYALERRLTDRHAAIGQLRAQRLEGLEHELCLHLIDESKTGAGANVKEPIAPGSRLRVLVNALSGLWREGRVVRCIPARGGYRIGLVYEPGEARRVAA